MIFCRPSPDVHRSVLQAAVSWFRPTSIRCLDSKPLFTRFQETADDVGEEEEVRVARLVFLDEAGQVGVAGWAAVHVHFLLLP